MALYSWPLWRAMLWYAPFFVTSTMVLWLRALKLCSPAVLSIGMNSNFVVRTSRLTVRRSLACPFVGPPTRPNPNTHTRHRSPSYLAS